MCDDRSLAQRPQAHRFLAQRMPGRSGTQSMKSPSELFQHVRSGCCSGRAWQGAAPVDDLHRAPAQHKGRPHHHLRAQVPASLRRCSRLRAWRGATKHEAGSPPAHAAPAGQANQSTESSCAGGRQGRWAQARALHPWAHERGAPHPLAAADTTPARIALFTRKLQDRTPRAEQSARAGRAGLPSWAASL